MTKNQRDTPIDIVTLAHRTQDFVPDVSLQGYTYQVDLGPDVRPRYHTVRKDRTCACVLGPDCPAVGVVARYLRDGGQRAPAPPDDYWLTVPQTCPICGGQTAPDPVLDGLRHGRGWRCLDDPAHYWQMRARPLIKAQRRAYAASPDYAGVPGISRQSPRERAAWLKARRIPYGIWGEEVGQSSPSS